MTRRESILCLLTLSWCLFGILPPATNATAQEPEPKEHASKDKVVDIVFARDGQNHQASGRVLVADEEGGVLLESSDGRRWVIESSEVVRRTDTEATFEPLSKEQLSERLLADLPDGFQTHTTDHFIICYNTSRQYALWTSSLFERLYRAFTGFWKGKNLELAEPEFPLVVMVYASKQQYVEATRDELGTAAESIVGYYHMGTNRVSMYDLTGSEALQGRSGRRVTLKSINRMLAQPAAVLLVATVVHEATHQIAYNCGLGQRLADLPLWQVEGMAVYFEAPDLTSGRGWQGIGKVNYPRLRTFKTNLARGNRSSVLSLIASDKPFRNPRTAGDAYANAWALNYYLIQYQTEEYTAYLNALAQQPPLLTRTAEERIALFREHFGDIDRLEKSFYKRMEKVD